MWQGTGAVQITLLPLLLHQRKIKIRSVIITSHSSLSGKAILVPGQMILQLFNIRSANLITCILHWTLHAAILKAHSSLWAVPKNTIRQAQSSSFCRMLCSAVISCFSHAKVTDTAKEAEMGFMAWHISYKTRALIIWREGYKCCSTLELLWQAEHLFITFSSVSFSVAHDKESELLPVINTAPSFWSIPWAL